MPMDTLFKQAARDLKTADCIVALTGAGISVESGIPPFRGQGGLWEKFDPMEYAHIDAFRRDPGKVWSTLFKDLKETVSRARPNPAHRGLAQLEAMGKDVTVITQNIDGLHQKAGNTDVIEFHGTFARHHCLDCQKSLLSEQLDLTTLPPRCNCGGVIRPDCIFFGEMIDPDLLRRSRQISSQCDIMLVIGTSAVVQPAAWMPVIAKDAGAIIIEINPEETPLTLQTSDYFIKGHAGRIMTRLVAEMTHHA